MYEQNSVFKYLKHQARCVEAQLGEEDKHCFFVGTYTPQPENELHLVEFIEETNEIITRNIFNHPNEIYSISSCPTNPSLLFTCHRGGFMDDILNQSPKKQQSTASPKSDDQNKDTENANDTKQDNENQDENDKDKDESKQKQEEEKKDTGPNHTRRDNPNLYKATLWRLIDGDASDTLDNDPDELNDDDYMGNSLNSKNLKLQPMFTLPSRSSILNDDKQLSTHMVLWDGLGVDSHCMSLADNCIQFWKFGDKFSYIKEDKCIYDEDRLNKLTSGCWDPHYPNRFISTNDKCIRVWSAKDLKETQTINNAHKACILSVDHNPNKPYHIVTSSQDRTIKFWDLRNTEKPFLKVLSNHSHWIWCVKYNRYHDQLTISCGSDSNVSLWNIVSVSSAPLGELEDNSKEEDKLIKTYKEHEESVYWTSWSANNAWVFASLSYDGRVVINHVPAATKYTILL